MATDERRTEAQILVRQVTHVQASWTEREQGEAGAFTLQQGSFGSGDRNSRGPGG
jgi:hypothetical protein